ncbi:MAG TPA: ABC transporter substrate-binding protein [Candidatus Udaeobacter sp.]|nr:ABC transporter substrate-binding protein [Candidatus Udaeobacter sp.]
MMRRACIVFAFALVLCWPFLVSAESASQSGGELHFCLRGEPKTFNPLLVEEDASETVRYLTGGVLIRLNRQTQALEPGLAVSWKVSEEGRKISFRLRSGLHFSDGTPFTSEDVAYTMKALMDPQLHSPTGDSFRSDEGQVIVQTPSTDAVVVIFPAPVAGLERLFDQVAILSAHSPKKEMAVLGPFYVADYAPGSHILLRRNTNYWKKDKEGKPLPYLDSIRLDIQRNRDVELLRFRRGEIHLINVLDAEYFDRLQKETPAATHDAGPGLDSEFLWFNQVPTAPVAETKRAWFRSTEFRKAVSMAINRADLSRIVFGGHAQPAFGPVSPANHFWFNSSLSVPQYDSAAALRLLTQAGFRHEGGTLSDSSGNRVEFTVITNSGNKSREQMVTMIQQDLSQIGIKVNLVTLDFPSLIERITRTYDYEACLLGLVNTDLDPNSQMNVWLSSAENHQWNPKQSKPATVWEAELDRLMLSQASTISDKKRKADWDRVQQIVAEQQPFIYLVNKHAMSAISPAVVGSSPSVLDPHAFWNVEILCLGSDPSMGAKK